MAALICLTHLRGSICRTSAKVVVVIAVLAGSSISPLSVLSAESESGKFGALIEPTVVFADTAALTFSIPSVAEKIKIYLQLQSSTMYDSSYISSMRIEFGAESVTVDRGMLDDIKGPVVGSISVSLVELSSGETVIAVDVPDQFANCSHRTPGCGFVEFEWRIGSGVKKIDFRTK